ncbi:MAG TPA: 50S ribosomal protein L39e [Candidatus Caldiarchaeum subterraneum]|uniref:Large ribosomal subunit protein eL39 n=1 Tax=Caldiarchaeum subterraneum TaxID=311458 RepID=A0A833E959_CALS0|nr:50S ribosomal protein L39e [Candidatus Caldarchaeum subterraneum]
MVRTYTLKKKLAKEMRRAWPVPTWVIARTNRNVRFSYRRRHWRRAKIKP